MRRLCVIAVLLLSTSCASQAKQAECVATVPSDVEADEGEDGGPDQAAADSAPEQPEQDGVVDAEAIEKLVRARTRALEQAELAEDAHEVAEFFAEDGAIYWARTPAVVGRRDVRRSYQRAFGNSDFQSTESETLSVFVSESGDVAVEQGVSNATYKTKKGKPFTVEGKYLIVWKQDGGEWLIAAYHSSSIR